MMVVAAAAAAAVTTIRHSLAYPWSRSSQGRR